jgi:hypothetical protein
VLIERIPEHGRDLTLDLLVRPAADEGLGVDECEAREIDAGNETRRESTRERISGDDREVAVPEERGDTIPGVDRGTEPVAQGRLPGRIRIDRFTHDVTLRRSETTCLVLSGSP